ncbi:MAG: GAF domain-containing protein [Vicinamibacteria bacterium]|nr:GAF domain-containing protein [Vicinamibacteria bacterium]
MPRARKPPPALPSSLLSEVLEIAAEINRVLDPQALLPTIAQHVRRLVDYKILDIFLPEPDGSLRPAFVDGYAPEAARAFRLRPGQGIVGAAAQRRETVFVADVTHDPRYVSLFPGVKAELAIPLISGDRLIGVLNVEGPDAAAFTEQARTLLQVLATHLAIAIENATLHGETRWYAGLLATLYEIGKETASILDLDALLTRVAEVVKRVIDYEMFGILLLDERAQELVMYKQVRFGEFKEKTRIAIGRGLCGTAAATKQPVLVGDVTKDPRYVSIVPETRSELVIPLIHKDKVIGVFDLESTVPHRFTEEHVKVLTPLASQAAIAIENARLYEALRQKEARLQRELAVAQAVQHGLFPEECPSGPGWEASAHFLPARELGGDLYDFYELENGRLGLSIGDVAGKGVAAALYGAFASGTVRARAFEKREPADLLQRVNRALWNRGIEGFYCTLTYAVFDFPLARLRISGSGMPHPLHYRAATAACERIEIAGLPLGTFEEASYEELGVELATGDVFVFFSDGVQEATRGDNEEYETLRLVRVVEAHAGARAPEIGAAILEDLEAFTGGAPQRDDITLVVVKIVA